MSSPFLSALTPCLSLPSSPSAVHHLPWSERAEALGIESYHPKDQMASRSHLNGSYHPKGSDGTIWFSHVYSPRRSLHTDSSKPPWQVWQGTTLSPPKTACQWSSLRRTQPHLTLLCLGVPALQKQDMFWTFFSLFLRHLQFKTVRFPRGN